MGGETSVLTTVPTNLTLREIAGKGERDTVAMTVMMIAR